MFDCLVDVLQVAVISQSVSHICFWILVISFDADCLEATEYLLWCRYFIHS